MTTLAIIGTAGRKNDFDNLDASKFRRMISIAHALILNQEITHLVSGGAAWADHVAVSLALKGVIPLSNLTVYMPSLTSQDYKICLYYWNKFYTKTGIEVSKELIFAQDGGAKIISTDGSFTSRNKKVAKEADEILAYTFGTNTVKWSPLVCSKLSAEFAGLKDGGTAHTWDASKALKKFHVCLD